MSPKNKAQLVTELAQANEIIVQANEIIVQANETIAQLKSQLEKKCEDCEKWGKIFKDFEVFKQQTNKEFELLKQEVKSLNVKSVKKELDEKANSIIIKGLPGVGEEEFQVKNLLKELEIPKVKFVATRFKTKSKESESSKVPNVKVKFVEGSIDRRLLFSKIKKTKGIKNLQQNWHPQ